jgi:hypothetical protein
MQYWVAYRIGSFALKEQFDSQDQARQRAVHLRKARQPLLVDPDIQLPTDEIVLARSVELRPGVLIDLCT